MERKQKIGLLILALIFVPCLTWLIALGNLHGMPKQNTIEFIKYAFNKTIAFEDLRLIAAYLGAIPVIFLMGWLGGVFDEKAFKGRKFKKRLRGVELVPASTLKNKTKDNKNEQIIIGGVNGIPMPIKAENRHLALSGGTGTGKSVNIAAMIDGILKRGDRIIVVDPNADMFSRFGKKGDVLLNPFDQRTTNWSAFNEIRRDFDYKNISGSVIPKSPSATEETWNGYARTLLESAMKKLKQTKAVPTMADVAELFNQERSKLKDFLVGTNAQGMFVGDAEKALASSIYVLQSNLPIYKEIAQGDFSIRDALDNGNQNFYMTWDEQNKEAMKPLISAWVDIFCKSILAMPEDENRKIWLFLDELGSLENMRSLIDALTKGRRFGLRVVAGLQSLAQLRSIYGKDDAQVLMANFRSLVVLGGAKTDTDTIEELSKALGEHEVVREQVNKTSGGGKLSKSKSEQVVRERIVLPSEISGLPDLDAYISLVGDFPVCKITCKPGDFPRRNERFVYSEL